MVWLPEGWRREELRPLAQATYLAESQTWGTAGMAELCAMYCELAMAEEHLRTMGLLPGFLAFTLDMYCDSEFMLEVFRTGSCRQRPRDCDHLQPLHLLLRDTVVRLWTQHRLEVRATRPDRGRRAPLIDFSDRFARAGRSRGQGIQPPPELLDAIRRCSDLLDEMTPWRRERAL